MKVRVVWVMDHDEREGLDVELADGESIIQINAYGPVDQGTDRYNFRIWIGRRL